MKINGLLSLWLPCSQDRKHVFGDVGSGGAGQGVGTAGHLPIESLCVAACVVTGKRDG